MRWHMCIVRDGRGDVCRAGRLGRRVLLPVPGPHEREAILALHLRALPMHASDSAAAMAAHLAPVTHGYVGADLLNLCREGALVCDGRTRPASITPPSAPSALGSTRPAPPA